MGAVVPFPRCRHRPFVAKHAANVASMPPARGERYLADHLGRQRAVMERRGISADVVDEQIRALELAIRARLWRLVLAPDGAA